MLAAGVLVAASLTFGSDSSSGPLQACVKTHGGAARLVLAGTHCRRGETAVAWNVRGAPGPRGAAGEAGARGTAGAGGTDGAPGEPGANGQQGQKGPRGTFKFDDLNGAACNTGTQQGTIHLVYDNSTGEATFTCS